MDSKVRTRFAPSPTGFLHVGGLRTALFKYLFANKEKGSFILRIDDTDRERYVAGALEHILESLRWLELDWDEGPDIGGKYAPYKQSERYETYQKYAKQFKDKSVLYPCWCSADRLNELRNKAKKEKKAFKYDRLCLTNPKNKTQAHVLRFMVPEKPGTVSWEDAVRGSVSVQISDIDDFIAIKSDGWPTYHFSSIVDDEIMKITHVIRGDEWVASTPKHLLLYQAMGWEAPIYAHVPTILGPDGKHKLSKRDNAKSAIDYKNLGYLPDAVVNYLAGLGFNDGTEKEIYNRQELIDIFWLNRISSSPAVFDERRLNWMNGVYIREMQLDSLYARAKSFFPPEAKNFDDIYKKKVLAAVQERLKYFAELPELISFFFEDLPINDELISSHKQLKKLTNEEIISLLSEAKKTLESVEESKWNNEHIQTKLNELLNQTSQKPAILFSLIRIATTQAQASPGLAPTLDILGKAKTIERINVQITKLK